MSMPNRVSAATQTMSRETAPAYRAAHSFTPPPPPPPPPPRTFGSPMNSPRARRWLAAVLATLGLLTATGAYSQDTTAPTVISVGYYADEAATIEITEAAFDTFLYIVIQFSENMENRVTSFRTSTTPSVSGLPEIVVRASSTKINAPGTAFTDITSCHAISASDTSEYICQLFLLASTDSSVAVSLNAENVRDLAGNPLAMDYANSGIPLVATPAAPTVTSITHYSSDAAARIAGTEISGTVASGAIYSVIQFAGVIIDTNLENPPLRDDTVRPQVFYQIGSAARVQFGGHATTDTPQAGTCALLNVGTGLAEANQSFWCRYNPKTGDSGVYKVIVGTGTTDITGSPKGSGRALATEYTADTGVMIAVTTDTATLSIASVVVDEGAGTATVNVMVDGVITGGFSVDAMTVDDAGTATDGEDYTAFSDQTLSFAGDTPGETLSFTVTILDDAIYEGGESGVKETVVVSLGTRQGTTLSVDSSATATISITDNEYQVALTMEDVSVREGAGMATVSVSLDTAVTAFSVVASTTDGTATAPGDYTAVTSRTLSFTGTTAGEIQSFSVTITTDDTREFQETLTVSLSSLDIPTDTATTVGTLRPATATITIMDDDLGTGDINLNLIFPITVNDKTYYWLDNNGNGVADDSNTGITDRISHQALDRLLNGGDDTVDTQPDGHDGRDDARSVIVGDSVLILPTRAEFRALRSSLSATAPAGWSNARYWTSTLTPPSVGFGPTHSVYSLTAPGTAGSPIIQNSPDATLRATVFQVITPIPLTFDTTTIPAPDSAYTYPVGAPITPLILPPANNGAATPLTYTLTPIPAGLTFDAAATTRTLSGTPTTPATTTAVTLTYTVTDANGMTITDTFTVTVAPLFFDTSTTPAPDSAYSYLIDMPITPLTLPPAMSAATPLTYTLTPIPDGLSFDPDPATRTLSGIPTTATAVTLTYTVTDANAETITATFTVTVASLFFDTRAIPAPDSAYPYLINTLITPLTLPPAMGIDTPLTYTLTPTASIPVGLSFDPDPATRTLSGTPTTATAVTLTYTVTDANAKTITDTFTVTVASLLFDTRAIPAPDTAYTYPVDTPITPLTLPPAIGVAPPLTYTLTPTASIPVGLSFDLATRTLAGTPTTATAVTLTYTVTDANAETITAAFTLTVVSETTTTTTRLNEQILTRASQAMTASTLEAVARRVEAAAGGAASSAGGTGSTPALAYQFGGQSSLSGLLKSHGKAMLEGEMEYEQLFDGASFVVPLSAAEGGTGGGKSGAGALSLWGSSNFINLGSDNDELDWDGQVVSINVGVDKLVGKEMLAGFALSSNQSSFDYDDAVNDAEGEYNYSNTILHPYIGWFPGEGLKLWASVGFGSGEIEINDDGKHSTDTTQQSLSGGFSRWLLNSTELLSGGATTLNLKGDVSMTSVDVEAKEGSFAEQKVSSTRLRVLVSGEQQRGLASGGRLMPSLEAGVRYDGGDGVTGVGVELGGGLRYANPDGNLTVAGNVRTLLVGEYDELGVDFTVQLAPGSGRGLSLSLHPVWGKTQSVADKLWNDGASEIAGEAGSDTSLQSSLDAEVGYGVAASILGAPGVLTPYTGMTATDGDTSHLRLGSRFADGNGLSLNLEGTQKNTTDGASHQVLLRGEVSF